MCRWETLVGLYDPSFQEEIHTLRFEEVPDAVKPGFYDFDSAPYWPGKRFLASKHLDLGKRSELRLSLGEGVELASAASIRKKLDALTVNRSLYTITHFFERTNSTRTSVAGS